MNQLNVSRAVDAPVEVVWEILIDISNSADRISAIISTERLDDGIEFGIGTRWRETRVMFGKEATEIMEVTAVDPGRSYTVKAGGRGANYTTVMAVEPTDSGSVVSMTFSAEPTSAFARFFASTVGKLFERATRKAIERDLKDIATVAANR